MESSNKLKILNSILSKLQEKPKESLAFYHSIFKGITIGAYLDILDTKYFDRVEIKVNGKKYDSNVHNFLLVDKVTVKETMLRKEFKEKITVQLDRLEDIFLISEETEKARSMYGYIVKLIILIKVKEN